MEKVLSPACNRAIQTKLLSYERYKAYFMNNWEVTRMVMRGLQLDAGSIQLQNYKQFQERVKKSDCFQRFYSYLDHILSRMKFIKKEILKMQAMAVLKKKSPPLKREQLVLVLSPIDQMLWSRVRTVEAKQRVYERKRNYINSAVRIRKHSCKTKILTLPTYQRIENNQIKSSQGIFKTQYSVVSFSKRLNVFSNKCKNKTNMQQSKDSRIQLKKVSTKLLLAKKPQQEYRFQQPMVREPQRKQIRKTGLVQGLKTSTQFS